MNALIAMLMGIFTVVELNCENLFDFRPDSLNPNKEWRSDSYRHWTPYRYWTKLTHISQELIACGRYNGQYAIPDLIALAEVENDSVLFDLTHRSILRKARYEYVMTNSPDTRGINVALLYSPFAFKLLTHYGIRVTPLKNMKPTRDILYAKGLTIDLDTLHVFVVHAPSRSGGELETRPHRQHVAKRLLQSVDSIQRLTPNARIIIAGDFNDTERDASIRLIVSHDLYDLSAKAKGCNGAKGTYRYHGLWQNLDHIFGTPYLHDHLREARIGDFEFVLTPDETYGGVRPKRNYIGMKYQNGFSDHLPLILHFDWPDP